jgi:2-hydroxychromene-2-carboxylate isomerase
MANAIPLYLDFASPYAYLALAPLARLAEEHGRDLELRPMLLWAVFKQQGVSNPIEKPARRRYFLEDVQRSADFFGVPLQLPDPLQVSAHLAARLFHAWTAEHPQHALILAQEIFEAFFVAGHDITKPETLARLPCLAAASPDAVRAALDGKAGRDRLAATIEEAVRDEVIGVPFTLLDGESFFGADRLHQIEWRLKKAAASPASAGSRGD